LLPLVIEANVTALRERAASSPMLARFEEAARALTGRAAADIADGVAFVAELGRELAVPSLSSYGMTLADVPSVVAKAAAASSMKGNPIVLTNAELSGILERAL
jgi:alcohol dehydrogenase class IV